VVPLGLIVTAYRSGGQARTKDDGDDHTKRYGDAADSLHGCQEVLELRNASLHAQAWQRRQAFHTHPNDVLDGRLRPRRWPVDNARRPIGKWDTIRA
jgi:hypothetical protein